MLPETLIKFCGFTDEASLELALSLPVHALGLNLVPSSKRYLRAPLALASRIDPARLWWVIGRECPELESVYHRFPGYVQRTDAAFVWPSWVAPEHRVEVVRAHADLTSVDKQAVLLLDAAGAAGGSGRTADWSFGRALASTRKVWLAGGLTATNVADAIRTVLPFGVDVASGIEDSVPGTKSKTKMVDFINAVVASRPSSLGSFE